MKKEKKVKSYQRRTKSGKTITVRAHTASYEAAEKAKEAAKKKGAGDEITERKKKNWELPMDEFLKKIKEERSEKKLDEETDKSRKSEDKKPKKSEKKTEKKTPNKKRNVGTETNGPEPKKKTTTKKTVAKKETSEPAFTKDEFKEWYRGTGSAADKKVAKALRKQLGRSGYRKFEDEAIDNYTSRGHLSMFKRVSGENSPSSKAKSVSASSKTTPKVSKPTLSKNMSENRSNASAQMKEYKKQLMSAIKDGNSKKIREARKGYMQAMDDSTFGGSKASKTSAEKDYQSVVKALSKAGYDEQGYKKKTTTKSSKAKKVSKQITPEQLKKEAAMGSTSTKLAFNIGGATYGKSEYDLFRKGGKEYAVNRKTGKLATDSMTAKIMDFHKKALKDNKDGVAVKYKKRPVGTGTNGPEPKLRKGYFASKADAVKSMKEKGYVVDSKGNVKTPFKNGVSTSKGRITKVGDTWALRHPTR